MREAYQTQLDGLLEELAVMCTSVGTAMRKATDALLTADLSLAEAVISEDMRIDDLRNHAEEKSFALLALQAPVATDLRVVVATIHAAGDTRPPWCPTRSSPTSPRWARWPASWRTRRPT